MIKYLIIKENMGQAQTVDQKVNTAKATIDNLHIEIKNLEKVINDEVSKLESDIANANYTDLNKLCDRIEYHYVDNLAAHFPITTLKEYGRIQLGLVPKSIGNMEDSKRQVCANIVSFYGVKLRLLEEIRKKTPECQVQEASIYNSLSEQLRSQNIDTQKWMDIYKKLQQFNKDIKYQYSKIANTVKQIRDAQNWTQLNTAKADVADLLGKTYSICTRYQADLNRFREGVVSAPVLNPAPASNVPLPSPPVSNVPDKPLPSPPVTVELPQAEPATAEPTPSVFQNLPLPTPPSKASEAPISPPQQEKPVQLPKGTKTALLVDYEDETPGTLTLKKGTLVTVIEYNKSGSWVRVQTDKGQAGWIGAHVLVPPPKNE